MPHIKELTASGIPDLMGAAGLRGVKRVDVIHGTPRVQDAERMQRGGGYAAAAAAETTSEPRIR